LTQLCGTRNLGAPDVVRKNSRFGGLCGYQETNDGGECPGGGFNPNACKSTPLGKKARTRGDPTKKSGKKRTELVGAKRRGVGPEEQSQKPER